jgi:hypothetical protein
MRNGRLLYRVAAGAFVLFAVGHTLGFLRFQPPNAQASAVWNSMTNVHFQVGSANLSYGGFYVGFGLYVTAYLIFSALLAWHLGELAARSPEAIGILGWVLCGLQVAGLVLSVIYFSTPPAMLSAILAACLGWAAISVRRASPSQA